MSDDTTQSPDSKVGRTPPRFELRRVDIDGAESEPALMAVRELPWQTHANRRGFLGAGLVGGAALAAFLGGCVDPCTDDDPDNDDQCDSGDSGGGSCSCNKVCTCIPVCQAHHLLDEDPVVARMAQEIVLSMAATEDDYLSWASDRAPTALSQVITGLRSAADGGLKSHAIRLPDIRTCVGYLEHRDPVIALMAAQSFSRRACPVHVRIVPSQRDQARLVLARGADLFWRRRSL